MALTRAHTTAKAQQSPLIKLSLIEYQNSNSLLTLNHSQLLNLLIPLFVNWTRYDGASSRERHQYMVVMLDYAANDPEAVALRKASAKQMKRTFSSSAVEWDSIKIQSDYGAACSCEYWIKVLINV